MSSQSLAVLVDGVTKEFNSGVETQIALDNINFSMFSGEFVALVGKSGSGKTTLLRLLSGLDSPNQGTVRVPKIRTVVFQEPRLVQSMKVWQNVALGLPKGADSKRDAINALGEVGLSALVNKWPATLSGGEAQRVALARALVRRPQLLLLDEPFGALDALTRLQMQDLIAQLCDKYRPATLLVTHDVEEAIVLADRVVVLNNGKLDIQVEVALDRPRQVGGSKFVELRSTLLHALGVSTKL
jgi:sulfonate transport system ATP-binding protein